MYIALVYFFIFVYLEAIFGLVHDPHSFDFDDKRNTKKIRNEIFVEIQNDIK